MTAIATQPTTTVRTSRVRQSVAVTTVIAAAATEVVVALARAAGVDVAIQGQTLAPGGCTIAVLMCMVVASGVLVAVRRWAASPARTWVRATVALTALSFVPDLTVPDTSAATRAVLITAHLVAAAVVIPAIARRLPSAR